MVSVSPVHLGDVRPTKRSRVAVAPFVLALVGVCPATAFLGEEALTANVLSVTALAVDPRSPDVIYAGTNAGVFKSMDAGFQWSATTVTSYTNAVATDPSSIGVVYAGTYGGFFRSTDGGVSWSLVDGGLAGAVVLCIAVDAAGSAVYAGVTPLNPLTPGPLGLYKSADRGVTWQATGLGGVGVVAVTVDPTNPQVLYAAPFGWPVMTASIGLGIVKSVDGGATWSPTGNPVKGGPGFISIAVDPQNPAIVYASWFIGIVFKSIDAGATWTRIEIGQGVVGGDSSVLAIDPSNPSTLYLATKRGVFRSTDGAVSWSSLSSSPQAPISALLVDRGQLLVGVGPGPFGVRLTPFQFYRSADGGATWTGASVGGTSACVSGSQNLCLSSGRFDVRVSWTAPPSYPGQRPAAPVPIVARTGGFWFFDSDNLELVVKVLDGQTINGRFWVFYGALSNVEYTITISDTDTGAIRTYFNPAGRLASVADTSAF